MISPRNPYKKFFCRACGWSAIHKQFSDVLFISPMCKRCGSDDFKLQTTTKVLDQVAYEAAQLLKKWT